MKKLLFRGFLVIVVLVLVGLVALYFSLNSIIKDQVQTQGTQATGVQTDLQSVNLNPFGGKLSLNELTLHNPEGFSDAKIFSLGEADVNVKLSSLLADEIVVPNVDLDGATILIELDGLNLNTLKLLENIQGSGEGDDAGEEGQSPEPAPDGDTRGYVINNLNITNTKLVGRVSVPGGIEQDIDLTLADINKTDVRGVELSDVIAFAVETILINASREVTAVVPNLEQLGGQVESIANDVLGDVGGRIDQAVPGAGEAVKNAAGKEVGKALEGIFGKPADRDAESGSGNDTDNTPAE